MLALWGIAFGAIGIYNQAAVLRAGGEHRDAANSLTVVTIQLGIAVGASYGAVAFTTLGAVLVPLAAAAARCGSLGDHRCQPERQLPRRAGRRCPRAPGLTSAR